MSFSFDDHVRGATSGSGSGEWNSNTFPYNLSTFTASSNVHPDLPSEPPGYDEFEYSLPSELSDSLFSLPFMSGQGNDLLSPTNISFPALSSRGASPPASFWPSDLHNNHAFTVQHDRRDSVATVKNKLFEDEEKHALDAFFNHTLDDSADQNQSQHPPQSSNHIGPSPVASTSTSTSMPPNDETSASSKNKKKNSALSATAIKSKVKSPNQPNTAKRKIPPASKAKSGKNAGKSGSENNGLPDSIYKVKSEVEVDELAESSHSFDSLTRPRPSKKGRIDEDIEEEDVDKPGLPAPTSTTSTGLPKRSNHIASEQKRRSSIKDNYKSLVELLLEGEATSGISILGGGEDGNDDDDALEGAGGKNITKKNPKPKGRGRGRKGQDGGGATKSVVLERAADYLRWLERGNNELEKEISRLEGMLAR